MTTLADIERAIERLGPGTVAYHEALAFYLLTMARAQWRRADQIAELERRKAKR